MIQQLLAILAALMAGITVSMVLSRIRFSTSTPSAMLGEYVGADARGPDPLERFGTSLVRRFPRLGDLATMAHHRRWLELAGEAPSPASVVGMAAAFGIGGLVLATVTQNAAALLLGAIGAVFPFIRVRSRANKIRRTVQRSLPDLSALMAAEMAANNPPDVALERAAKWGGPLSNLIRQAITAARSTSQPVFGRGATPGTLVQVAEKYDVSALQAFVRQLDLAARTGAAGPEQMERLAATLIIEYKDRALREAEQLDSRLAVPAVLFFFLPFMFLILMPLVYPLLEIL